MISRLSLLALVLALGLAALAAPAREPDWFLDLDDAFAAARESGRPILLVFR